jgi:hypothetical protein
MSGFTIPSFNLTIHMHLYTLQFTKLVNGPSYRKWRLSLPIMSALFRLGGCLLSEMTDKNYYYLVRNAISRWCLFFVFVFVFLSFPKHSLLICSCIP